MRLLFFTTISTLRHRLSVKLSPKKLSFRFSRRGELFDLSTASETVSWFRMSRLCSSDYICYLLFDMIILISRIVGHAREGLVHLLSVILIIRCK